MISELGVVQGVQGYPLSPSELSELRVAADLAGAPQDEPLLLEDVGELAQENQRLIECCELLREENRRLRAVCHKIRRVVIDETPCVL